MTPATASDRTVARRHSARLAAVAVVMIAGPIVILAVVMGALTATLPWAVAAGAVVGSILAGALVVPALRQAEARVLQLLELRPADVVSEARLFNLVEGLCTAAGVVRPQLFVMAQPAANAITVGRDARHGCLVVTEGLLSSLSRIELEAVLAHELAHLRTGDTTVPTTVLALCGPLATGALAGVATRLVSRAAPPDREAAADQAAVSLTRYPPGLVSALERIRERPARLAGVPAATGPLWLVPIGSSRRPEVLGDRIEALQEL
jgi:heat shock protein HtpX